MTSGILMTSNSDFLFSANPPLPGMAFRQDDKSSTTGCIQTIATSCMQYLTKTFEFKNLGL